ncbi:hypothetical protein HMPREF1141_3312 [Clostridium sp. MSTE9]|nr:hypothetical protein HMPREF1141_3312 [Clostridium sp. MSTE9]
MHSIEFSSMDLPPVFHSFLLYRFLGENAIASCRVSGWMD